METYGRRLVIPSARLLADEQIIVIIVILGMSRLQQLLIQYLSQLHKPWGGGSGW